ncbi:hypothetical protein H6G20_02940 [Desertifilum sp. FACHB-1129]|nr:MULTISPECIES: hypothetical protein [Desertifilum]MCD8487135.1 hypothetical protein [Desertifilum sp.]MDA0209876.1 hypothetical protein [Cyanobacteria bacterium FC1]MDI9638973.1 hypothetical protein [Geitlerinema splendidum]MBD2310634.1 hypothetical protein [Desertifilum sp. FACHB-1129]MBD2320671.1 hypothetical protein [Desertifilum sp. FACHB-866]
MLRFHKFLLMIGFSVAVGGLPTIAIAQEVPEGVTLSGESLNVEDRTVNDLQTVWLEASPLTTLEVNPSPPAIDATGVRVNLNEQLEYIQREGANNPSVAFPFAGNQPIGNEGQFQFRIAQ